MNDSMTGWVTFHRIPLHDGRVIVVQKNDGRTRTFLEQRPAPRVLPVGHGEMATIGHINPSCE